ncbi:MAG: HTH domain-containing protein [Thermodesulfobacteriota bacterium]
MSKWTFLTNHALVFIFLANHPKITARELSMSIGITERAIRKMIADLEMDRYIEKVKEGRGVRYNINPKLSFRHHTQQDKAIKTLLVALGWKQKKKK